MRILRTAGLVYLANPKTASQAIRVMLRPHSERPQEALRKPHMSAAGYARLLAPRLTQEFGCPPETVAVMREPMEHMQSWFRYRQREALKGRPKSTAELDFPKFVKHRLSDDPPPYARIGRQDRFLGFSEGTTPVTHVFDYARLDLLVAYLQDRLGVALTLGMRNVSPWTDAPAPLPRWLDRAYRREYEAEFALYERVAATGHLITA